METTFRIIFFCWLSVLPVYAQFDGIKIMVNPGHGGHDSDDRYIPSTGFWESEGNLTKGLHLRDLLKARGAQVLMSRTQNRTIDDLPLSQISGIANTNNVDYFQSIHSNGFEGTANRTGVFWEQLSNGQPDFPLAKQASEILAEKIYEVDYTTSYSDHGDLTYLGFNLGVLRSLNMPGCLTEGSFHDYIPESYRLLNLDYRKHEAVAILRGILEYFNLPSLEYGAIAGLAKNKYDVVNYNFSGGNFNDRYIPINNLLASVYKDTFLLGRYHGDFNNNGYFVFDSIAAGNYTLILDYGYFKADTLQVSVAANQTAFLEIFPQASNQIAPLVYETYPLKNQQNFNTYSSLQITFNQRMQQDSSELSFSIFPEISGNFSWKENNQVLLFNPQIAFTPQTEYTVIISTQALNTTGIHLNEDYSFTFSTANDHIYPTVINTIPSAADSITVFENIEFYFDQDMIREKVENAFTIEPAVEGNFVWSDDKHFTFYPDTLAIATNYSVTLSDSALNTFSVGLETDYHFEFKTYKRNSLNIVDWYPGAGSIAVSTRLNFYFRFDGILDVSTVLANIALYDDNDNSLETVAHQLEERNGTSVLRFDAKEQLKRNKMYRIVISPGIKDIDALILKDTLSYSFTTEKEGYETGVIFDDFEEQTGWQDPNLGPGSQYINDNSYFGLSFVKKISASKSAIIDYQFSGDSLGICQVFREDGYTLSISEGSTFGLWIYGDYSFNTIEIWYDTATLQNLSLKVDTLNYSGWKLVKLPAALFEYPDINIHSIVIKQQAHAYSQGRIYVDDMQTDIITDLPENENLSIVTSCQLMQNYPNPFNPSTIIIYSLGTDHDSPVDVDLSIYNMLGQKVVTLVNKKQSAGKHSVIFYAGDLASGLYICRLETNTGFKQTRKMLLLR